jgi:hypothetical protein
MGHGNEGGVEKMGGEMGRGNGREKKKRKRQETLSKEWYTLF